MDLLLRVRELEVHRLDAGLGLKACFRARLSDRRRHLPRPDRALHLVRSYQQDYAPQTCEHPGAGCPSPDRHSPLLPSAFSNCTAQYLYSGIFAVGSSASIVSRFAAASTKWNGTKTDPGETLPVIRA